MLPPEVFEALELTVGLTVGLVVVLVAALLYYRNRRSGAAEKTALIPANPVYNTSLPSVPEELGGNGHTLC